MPLMDWDDRLSVGVKQIDDEHKHLIKLVNELHDAIRANQGKEVLGRVLDGLIAYTGSHFGHEESEMKRTNYPQASSHAAEHAALVKKVLAIQAQYRAGKVAVLGMETLAFLRDWLVRHIKGTDQALGQYLKAQASKKVA